MRSAVNSVNSEPSNNTSVGGPSRWPPLTTAVRAPIDTSSRAARRALSTSVTGPAYENLGLPPVGGDEQRHGQQVFAQGVDSIFAQKAAAHLRDHHRVDHQPIPRPCSCKLPYNAVYDGRAGEHSGLHRVCPDIRDDRVDLGPDDRRGQLIHIGHAPGVLGGNGSKRGRAVNAHRGKGFEVRLNAGAGARVGPGDRHYGWDFTQSPDSPEFEAFSARRRMTACSRFRPAPVTFILRCLRRLASRRCPFVSIDFSSFMISLLCSDSHQACPAIGLC